MMVCFVVWGSWGGVIEIVLAIIGVVLGGIITILTTIRVAVWIEKLRSPRIKFEIEDDPVFERGPIGPYNNRNRVLRIRVSNEPPSRRQEHWIVRLPAQHCVAEISFHRLNGTAFFERPMAGRWGNTPEPIVMRMPAPQPGGQTVPVLVNPYALSATVDIYPGEKEILDIVARVDGEDVAYGWNNETYFFEDWRNTDRQLPRQQYLIEVTITSSGRKRRKWFCINNDGPFNSFRLTELTSEQRQVVGPDK